MNDKEMKKALDDEIFREILNLETMDEGSERHSDAVSNVCRLSNLIDSIERSEKEMELRERELDIREKELEKKDTDDKLQIGLSVGTLVLTVVKLAFDAYWMRKGFQFEETGTYTSKTMKDLTSRVFRRQKGTNKFPFVFAKSTIYIMKKKESLYYDE